jgi:ApaG protein
MPRYQFSCSVATQYLADKSNPTQAEFAFAYTVTIKNDGEVAAQLIARHWIITDTNNHTEEVKGLGVIGHQPLLKPGEAFEYTSWAQIATPEGTMKGRYFCVAEDTEHFEAEVYAFVLSQPRTLH